ncbi:hypothetical protein GCM10008986_33280 [Salinibacillus aidingensis]|uniref:DUF4367 domain-containing protein n=1 Tax=Salinibacillus aidingensis TaxID=237684 RepID=A0ABP3LP36_9BACI
MKQTLTFVIMIVIGILSACSSDSNPSQETISNYPEKVQDKVAELPEEIRETLVVPAELPENMRVVDFDYTSEPVNDPDGKIILTTFTYAGDSSNLLLNTKYGNVSYANEKSSKTVTLENGMEANVSESSVRWENENGHHHELSLIEPPDGTGSDVTMDDLIEIANSME